jgi:hypothetical protein
LSDTQIPQADTPQARATDGCLQNSSKGSSGSEAAQREEEEETDDDDEAEGHRMPKPVAKGGGFNSEYNHIDKQGDHGSDAERSNADRRGCTGQEDPHNPGLAPMEGAIGNNVEGQADGTHDGK